jgi:colanic acid biosynthesis glycosyl transferase WcaI
MRIVVHTINYSPELTGIGKYTTEMCEWLAAQGHEVTVVTPPPYYPQWRVAAPHRQWRYSESELDGVRVRRAPIWIPRRPGGLSRILYELSFALFSFPLLLSEALRKPGVLMVLQPSFLNSPGAWAAARLSGARAWLHVQDFEIDLAYDLGQLKRGKSLVAAVESWMLRRFDLVSAISDRMLQRAHAKGAAAEKLFLLPNWFNPESIFPMREPSHFRARLGLPAESFVALFAGSLGAKQGLEMLIHAARLLSDLPLYFVICGEGVAGQPLRQEAHRLGNVRFLPLQPVTELNALLNLADVHLLPQRKGAAQSVFPSKLIGMLASGRPVLAMSEPGSEVAALVEGCGLRVDHEDVQGFADAIRNLVGNQEERQAMGRAARARALERFRQEAVFAAMQAELLSPGRLAWESDLAESRRALRRPSY